MKNLILNVIGFNIFLWLTIIFFVLLCSCVVKYIKELKADNEVEKKKAVYAMLYSFVAVLICLAITILI